MGTVKLVAHTLIFSFCVLTQAHAQGLVHTQELIQNGFFSSGVEGWSASDLFPGAMAWESASGNPPGSLRIDGSQKALTDMCFPITGEEVEWNADVFRTSVSGAPYTCSVLIDWYIGPGCSGANLDFPAGPHGPPIAMKFDEWEQLQFRTRHASIASSFKFMLFASANSSGEAACLFDNVSLVEIGQPLALTEVPVLDSHGLFFMATTLGVAALWVLRRFR